MDLFINTFHVILCVVLILVILLQPSKGSDIGAAFGGGGSNTMFGPRGAGNMLSKATTVIAVLFMVTSISLAVRSTPEFAVGTSLGDDILGGGLQELDFGDIDDEPLSDFPELDELLNSTGELPVLDIDGVDADIDDNLNAIDETVDGETLGAESGSEVEAGSGADDEQPLEESTEE